jgi:hypothetical protein
MPSSTPRPTSVGIPRTVRVIGATSTVLSTGIAAERLITRNGRRPTSSISPHQTSPRRGSLTKARPRSRPAMKRRPIRVPPHWQECVDIPPGQLDRSLAVVPTPPRPRVRREQPRHGSRRRPERRACRPQLEVPRGAVQQSALSPWAQYTRVGCIMGCDRSRRAEIDDPTTCAPTGTPSKRGSHSPLS